MPSLPDCYYDLDKTLFNTPQLTADVECYLRSIGHDDASIRHTRSLAVQQGYSFERHLRLLKHPRHRIPQHAEILGDLLERGDRYLLPGVAEGLAKISALTSSRLLTFGDPTFQGRKFRGIRAFDRLFTSECYLWNGQTKGDTIQIHGPRLGTWYLEDAPEHLNDVQEKAPWVHGVRMRAREVESKPHPGDGIAWIVVESFSEYLELVLNAN